VTDASGRFVITGLTGDQVTLEVRRIGYRPSRVRARLGETNLRISLTEQSVALAEVIVTGTAGGQARREIGNAVSTINAAEVAERGTVTNIQQMLNARAPGVFVNPSAGAIGTGSRIRIRGSSSMFLSNEPLIYVDGVRINSQSATGPINQGFGGNSISRINDINPEDIESIEVIKGPAAATLYGTEASNGVIQIITKRGTAGAPRWGLSTRQGFTYIRDAEGRWPTNYGAIPRPGSPGVLDTVSHNILALEDARGTPVFQKGPIREYDLQTSGGSSLFRYFAAGGIENSDGVEPTNQVKRRTGRMNLQVTPNSRLDVGLNVGYTNGNITLPCDAGCGGRALTTLLATPTNLVPLANGDPNPRRGFHSGLPEAYDAFYEFYQIVDRFTAGFQANQQLAPWFRHRLTAGTDRTREENSELSRRIEDSLFRAVLGTSGLGGRGIIFRGINNYTVDYSGSAVFDLPQTLRSTTSIGSQYYRNRFEVSCASGTTFPAVGIFTVDATTQNRTTCHDIVEDATLGFFVQEQIGWRDRLFLTAAVRADDNSAFGRNFDRVYYPKYSVSWVVSEEPFWRFPFIDALKLRAAYGEAGKQPITFSALQTYESATGPTAAPTVTPLTIGNPDLGPERSKEVELGFDFGAFQDRFGGEFTWYRKKTVDAILEREIAPSLGIPGTQPFNAGSVRNWGTELLLRGRPVVRDRVSWDVSLGLGLNDSEVEDLGGIGDFVVASGAGNMAPWHRVGYPIGSIFQKRLVAAQLDPASTRVIPSSLLCDDGQGGSTPCATAPRVFLGRTTPKTEGSFSNTLTLFGNLRAFALVDFKRGHWKVDGTTRFRCVVLNNRPTDPTRAASPGRCRENWYPMEYDPKLIASLDAGTDVLPDGYIHDASFSRLRELSLSYTLPTIRSRYANFNRAVVTLAGRNLAVWTDYPGLEPEASWLGGTRGGNFNFFEQTTIPQTSQWVLSVNLDW
jgi:TonB-dependent SusC/RagA subfamily outer membrane receptor